MESVSYSNKNHTDSQKDQEDINFRDFLQIDRSSISRDPSLSVPRRILDDKHSQLELRK